MAASAWAQTPLHRRVMTADGVALALYRLLPAAPSPRPAVLMIPDVGLGREAFELRGRGLGPLLASQGRDVFIAELRGQGQSGAPAGWHLSDWIASDLPAVLAAVEKVHPGPVDLVVHGYAGGLVLAAVPVELRGRVHRVVALSPVVAADVPNPIFVRLMEGGGALGEWARGSHAAELAMLLHHGGRFTRAALSGLSDSVRDLDPVAAHELLGWARTGSIAFADGSTLEHRLAAYDRPTLLLLPLGDNFAHPEFASPLRELAPNARVTEQVLSRFNLLEEDYTHWSVLQGADVEHDVGGPVRAFLDAPVDAPVDAPIRGPANAPIRAPEGGGR